MTKKVAVLAVNPVNGLGLFSYLETFFENKIPYRVFAVYNSIDIKTNCGLKIKTDDVIEDLVGHAADYDALVFSCGDAVPIFAQNARKSYNKQLIQVIQEFATANKLLIGHCGAGVFFDIAGVDKSKQIACHPYVKNKIKNGIYACKSIVIDVPFFTAAEEHDLPLLLPEIVKALK